MYIKLWQRIWRCIQAVYLYVAWQTWVSGGPLRLEMALKCQNKNSEKSVVWGGMQPTGAWWRPDDVSNHCISSVYSTVCPGADQRKHQSPASLAFARGIHRWLVNSPHEGLVRRKMFPFDDVIMQWLVSSSATNHYSSYSTPLGLIDYSCRCVGNWILPVNLPNVKWLVKYHNPENIPGCTIAPVETTDKCTSLCHTHLVI